MSRLNGEHAPNNNAQSMSEQLLERFTINLERNTLPHANLFYGLSINHQQSYLQDVCRILLCHCKKPSNGLCCQSCQLLAIQGHPDLTEIQPEKKTSPIKIEAIRDLNQFIYLSPQLGGRRVIVIHHAERMNTAASNALLKLLEEPPQEVYFILQADHLSTLLPTLLSRCQIWNVATEGTARLAFHDMISTLTEDETELRKIIADLPQLVEALLLVGGTSNNGPNSFEKPITQQPLSVTAVATKWVQYDLSTLITVLYWINSDLIKGLTGQQRVVEPLEKLLPHLSLHVLFAQMDKLNSVMQRLNASVAVNALLTIEDYLLGYTPRK